MLIYEFIWSDDRIDHIAGHGVTAEEVEQVCCGRALVLRAKSQGHNPVYLLLSGADPERPLPFLRRDQVSGWKRLPSDGSADDRQRNAPLSAMEKPMTQPRIPSTDSISELAAFWSTHDLTDYEDELETVEGPVFVKPAKGEDLVLHLDPEEAITVREAARAKGIDEAAVVREWIREHAPKAAG